MLRLKSFCGQINDRSFLKSRLSEKGVFITDVAEQSECKDNRSSRSRISQISLGEASVSSVRNSSVAYEVSLSSWASFGTLSEPWAEQIGSEATTDCATGRDNELLIRSRISGVTKGELSDWGIA